MHISWQALFFAIILLSSISVTPLTFAQSYGVSSNKTEIKLAGIVPATPKCQVGQISFEDVCLSTETTCPSGFSLGYDNICIFSKPSCPSGSISGNGICTLITPICNIEICHEQAPILACPVGTELDGICVLTSEIQPTPPMICPEGFGFQNNSCIPSSTLSREGCPTGTVLQNDVCVASTTQSEIILSPLKQFKSGIAVQDVKCEHGLQPVIKSEDSSPACVTPATFTKLISLKWGFNPSNELTVEGLDDSYRVYRQIDFTIKFHGIWDRCDFPHILVTNQKNQKIWQGNNFSTMSCPVVPKPYTYFENEMKVGSPDLGILRINQTGTYTIDIQWYGKEITKQIIVYSPAELGGPASVQNGNNITGTLTNQESSAKESIRIIPENEFITGINKDGTMSYSNTIEILFDNFKQTDSPLIIKIFNPKGELYKEDDIPSSNIQSDGFYKYQIYLKGNESDMGEYQVVVTYDNATALTSGYLSNVVP